ncbi:MAG: PEF-CTERM sorting domain-containing protein [Nitrosotalea sp.]
MNNYLMLSSLAVLASFLSFSIHDAHAVTYDLKDQASCQAISGAWYTSTSTCTISDFSLNSGDSLAVDNSVFPNISLTITDTLDNSGVINNSGSIEISNYGVFNNDGSIVNYCTVGCVGGTINNDGTITNNNGGTITSNSTIVNNGSINNSGTIIIKNGGTINNYAKFINNDGTVNNYGTIHNNQLSAIINTGGTIINYATIVSDVRGTITNSGTLKNMCGGTFTSNGDLLGNPVSNISCTTTPKSSTVPEFPFAMPILVISFLSMIVFYKTKK